ncbi:MAG: amidohydrolase family protein [Actinomycetota bacterium]|nr:amidohydrolase family protein [Actinomycetota bacterium]
MPVLTIPGFVDAHCHAFQRALRGRSPGGDFWAWRDGMVALAESLSVDDVRREYTEVYRELRANGFTAVGEFHYLGLEEARAAAAAATEAGVAFVCLYACYLRGGSPRFRQGSVADYLHQLEALRAEGFSVGVAPHSVRACSAGALRELGRYASEHALPLHVHADEQPREIEECVAEHGLRPIELLAREGCLGPRTTVIHATHADGRELDLLRDAGARICACLTTEANLGDGFLPVARVCHREIGICIGSDSNARIDPLEELRELEGIARRQTGRRGVISLDSLLSFGSDEGAAALGLESWADAVVDLDHPQLRSVDEADVYEALVFSCSGDVLRNTSAQ